MAVLSLLAAFHIKIYTTLPTASGYETGKEVAVYSETYHTLPSMNCSPSPLPIAKKEKKAVFLGKFKITAYCPCEECSEGYGNNTSTGVKAKQGRTIAVDPSVIPYGTKVYIKGIGEFTAEDCGGDVKGKHIDIYFNSHEETVEFGVKHRKVERR